MARVVNQSDKQADASAESAPLLPLDAARFYELLALWYRRNARKLPWRGIRNPYATWLSEIMLQQTRVAAVIDRYTIFLDRFPTIAALAEADEADVLALWSGLGYYRRARLLHRGAQFVTREMNGKLPRTSIELRTLPGVGEYTAAAIASIAFREPIAVLDGNVERVLLRILGREESKEAQARTALLRVAQALVPQTGKGSRSNPPGDHNQAMMELGATICLPRAPLCLQCPVLEFCRTRGEHSTVARDKPRSRAVAHLLALRKRGVTTEVLLERRPENASLMPGMLELPPLPLDAVANREPVLRLRHSITNTSYYVQIHTASAMGAAPRPIEESDPNADDSHLDLRNEDAEAFVEPLSGPGMDNALMHAIPASSEMLLWCAATRLPALPLTGLARKALQRLGVMALFKPRIAPPQR
jgi:A/G-specific adenine glycosylase